MIQEDLTPGYVSLMEGETRDSKTCYVWVGMEYDEDDERWHIEYFKANYRLESRLSEFEGEETILKSTLKGLGRPMLCTCISHILFYGRRDWNRDTKITLDAVPLDEKEFSKTKVFLKGLSSDERKGVEERFREDKSYNVTGFPEGPLGIDTLATWETKRRLVDMYRSIGFACKKFESWGAEMESTLGRVREVCYKSGSFGILRLPNTAVTRPVSKKRRRTDRK